MEFLANLQSQSTTATITRENVLSEFMNAVAYDEILLLEFVDGQHSEKAADNHVRKWHKFNNRMMKHIMTFAGMRKRSDAYRTLEFLVWEIESNVRKTTRAYYENMGSCGYTVRRIKERMVEIERFFH